MRKGGTHFMKSNPYVNMSEGTSSCGYYEDIGPFNNQQRPLGGKLYKLVVLSFGLLCILQAGLNIILRTSLYHSEDTEAMLKNMTKERDEMMRKLTIFADYSHRGWVYFSGSFYYISLGKKSWKESRSDCQQKGADLVIINSKEEQDFTRRFRREIWIGLTDSEEEGIWKWIDGTPLTMRFWGTDEPNSHKGSDEDCGEIKFYDNENSWNDKPCDIENVWICEKTLAL